MNMSVLALCVIGHVGAISTTQNVEVIPARVDLGEQWQGEVSRVSLKLHNRGTRAVPLGEVKASCGCISAKMPKRRLDAGEEMEVKVEILRHTSGKFHDPLIFLCEGESQPVRVNISGSIRETYLIHSTWRREGKPQGKRVLLGESARCLLPDLDTDDQGIEMQLTLEGVRPQDPFAQAVPLEVQSSLLTVVKEESRPGPQGELRRDVRLRLTKPLRPGLHSSTLKVKIGDGPILVRTISFRVRGPVWPENVALNLGILRDGQVKRHTCKVHFRPGTEPWSAARVLGTVPAPFAGMVEVVGSTLQEGVLAVELQVDVRRAPPDAKDFFHFELRLSGTNHEGQTGNLQESQMVALQVYGMRRP
jgi:hypothetical protein